MSTLSTAPAMYRPKMGKKLEKGVLSALVQKGSFYSTLFIIWNWFLVALVITLCEQLPSSWLYMLYIPSVWFIGSRMVALAEVFGHDSVHYNLFKRRSLNRRLDFLWFLPLFESWESYRAEHSFHHSDLLTPKDPAWQDYKRWGLWDKGNSKKRLFWMWWIRPLLCFDSLYSLKSILSGLLQDRLYRRKILAFWGFVILITALLNGFEILLLYWIVPLFWSYPALIFWSETGEHYGAEGDLTRNTLGFLEWLMISPHNDRFHYVHHAYPRIPWYKMKKAYHLIFKDEKVPCSRGFLDLYRQVRQRALAV